MDIRRPLGPEDSATASATQIGPHKKLSSYLAVVLSGHAAQTAPASPETPKAEQIPGDGAVGRDRRGTFAPALPAGAVNLAPRPAPPAKVTSG